MMKTAVCVVLLIILPCVAWADTLSDAEAYRMVKQHYFDPCVEHMFDVWSGHQNTRRQKALLMVVKEKWKLQTYKELMDKPSVKELVDNIKNTSTEERELYLKLGLASCKENVDKKMVGSVKTDTLSVTEAYMIYKKQVIVPCVEYVLRIQEMPVTEQSVSYWSKKFMSESKESTNGFIDVIINNTPAELRKEVVKHYRNICKNTVYIPEQ